MKDDPFINADDAVERLMRVTGKTRRQAKLQLIEWMRSGELRAVAVNSSTNEVEMIPPEVWPVVN